MLLLRVLALTTISLFAAVHNAAANPSVGVVSEQTGPTEIQRNRQMIVSEPKVSVEMNDAIITAKARVGIVFRDSSTVQITEQSKLVIDSFVFDDSKQDAGKIGLKMALGTARFASGQIAKHSPESIKVETPTATIGVRGTDFTLTVDEMGRSLIILLPSCPVGFKNIAKDCIVGEISVTTDMGVVILNRAFQATTVNSRENTPAKPTILRLNADQINNLLIVTPPKEIRTSESNAISKQSILDHNELDKDLLKFVELNVNYLTGDQLSINRLDQEFLNDVFDYLNAQQLDNALNNDSGMLPRYNANRAAGLKYFVNDSHLTLYRQTPSHYAEITVDKDNQTTLNLIQDGVSIVQNVNRAGGSNITIRQNR